MKSLSAFRHDVSRRPGMATALYLLACAGFAAVIFWKKGARLPSSSLLLTFLAGVALAWTLDVLARYARDTKRLAEVAELQAKSTEQLGRTAIEQRDLTLRPVLALVLEIWDAGDMVDDVAKSPLGKDVAIKSRGWPCRVPSEFQVENIGIGPAMDIELKKVVRGLNKNPRLHIPHLRASESRPTDFLPAREIGEWWIEFRYMGVSGAWFISRYYVVDDVIVGFGTFLQRSDPDTDRVAEWRKEDALR